MTAIPATAEVIALVVAIGALLAAALADLRFYRIPDRYAMAIAVAFLVVLPTAGWHAALNGLAIGAAVFALGALFFARNWLGGGDVKLLAAIALWVPPPLLASFALVTSLASAVLSAAMLTPLRRCLPTPPAALAAGRALRQPVPFAIAIAAGGLFVLVKRITG